MKSPRSLLLQLRYLEDPTLCYILRPLLLKPHTESLDFVQKPPREKCVADNLDAVTLQDVTVAVPNGM